MKLDSSTYEAQAIWALDEAAKAVKAKDPMGVAYRLAEAQTNAQLAVAAATLEVAGTRGN